jgi:hypothetical protein
VRLVEDHTVLVTNGHDEIRADYSTVQCSTVQCSAVQYSTVQEERKVHSTYNNSTAKDNVVGGVQLWKLYDAKQVKVRVSC